MCSSDLVDTAPELRLQCLACGVKRVDAVAFTHAHADHIMGLDDVRRFNAISGRAIDAWAAPNAHAILHRCFGYAFSGPAADVKAFRPHLLRRDIDGPFEVGPMRVEPIPLLHGDLEVLGFRVGRLAYCTDVSRVPEASYALLEGLDVLVIDGLQYQKHPTHLTIDEAVEVSARIGARETWLTHIAHGVSHAKAERRLPAGVRLAYDGLKVGTLRA